MTNRYESLKLLLDRMDTIEGITEGGRHFKIEFNRVNESFFTQIFSGDGTVYEPRLRMSDILKNNILSTINKIDEMFFDRKVNTLNQLYNQHYNKKDRKSIVIKGKQLETPFTARIRIENTFVNGRLNFKESSIVLRLTHSIPDYIHLDQRHNWLYLHFQKPEVLLEIIKFNIKEKYYQCCGNSIFGHHNYCYSCGKKQEVNDLTISNIVGTKLLTLLY